MPYHFPQFGCLLVGRAEQWQRALQMSQHGTEHGILGDMVPRQPAGGSGKVEFRGLMCVPGSFSTPSIGDNLIPPFNRESL